MSEPAIKIVPPAATGEPPKRITLAQKIKQIQDSVGIVSKKGRNTEHNYKFLRIEDAVTSVNKLMSERELILTPTLQKKPDGQFYFERQPHKVDKGYMVSLVLSWTLEDTETGETRQYDIPGEGYDTTDKAGPKAITASRKQAIILIFNIPVGDEAEATKGGDAKATQKSVAASKIADAAGRGNQTAIDKFAQMEPEKTLIIARPEEMNGHYIIATGFIADPALDQFFEDTGCKRLNSKTSGRAGWKVPAEYETGLVRLCEKLKIEIEG
jgi:hypothetical protein